MKKLSLDEVLKRLTWMCYGLTSVLTLLLGVFLIGGFSSTQNSRATQTMITGMKKRLADDLERINRARKLGKQASGTGLEAGGVFQSKFESIAKKHGVDVTEFRTATDLAPFLTAYAKETADEGWMQIDARATAQGRLVDVMSCLTDLGSERFPFEIDSVELTRTIDQKVVRVTANVQMRVLTKPNKGSKE